MPQRAYHVERPAGTKEAPSKGFRVRGLTVTYHRSYRAALIEVSRLQVAGLDNGARIEKRGADGQWVAAR